MTVPLTKIGRRRALAIQISKRLREMQISGASHPGACESDRSDFINIWHLSFGPRYKLTTNDAEKYLAYLQAGHTGNPSEWQRDPNPPLRRYLVSGRVSQEVTIEVEASSASAAHAVARDTHSRAWMLVPDSMDATVTVHAAKTAPVDAAPKETP
jgi:hypothetical protein